MLKVVQDEFSPPARPEGLGQKIAVLRNGKAPDRVRLAWDILRDVPRGRWLFSRLIGRLAPYSGSIGAELLELRRGYARAKMLDRSQLRNHLGCLHAIALANLAEFTGNVALAYSLASDARFIVTRLEMEYVRKARGVIEATCASPMPTDNVERDIEIKVDLSDSTGEVVARGVLHSRVGPLKRALATPVT